MDRLNYYASNSTTEELSNRADAAAGFNHLMDSLNFLIEGAEGTREEKDRCKGEVYSEVIIPGLKDIYEEAVHMVLFGITRKRPISRYRPFQEPRKEYVETEEED